MRFNFNHWLVVVVVVVTGKCKLQFSRILSVSLLQPLIEQFN